MADKTIHNFMFLQLSDAYWDLRADSQDAFIPALARELEREFGYTHFYQVSPMMADVDLLVWNSAPLEMDHSEADFFDRLARVFLSRRAFLLPVENYWGYTRPSSGPAASSAPEIDFMSGVRSKYLVLFPFMKASPSGLGGMNARQGSSDRPGWDE